MKKIEKQLAKSTFLKIHFYFTHIKATSEGENKEETSQYSYSICVLLWRRGNKSLQWESEH